MDPSIEKIKISGGVSVWKITGDSKNYPGWHIACTPDSRVELINLFDKMLASDWTSKKDIILDDPLNLGQNWLEGCGGYKSMSHLIISYRQSPTSHWKIELSDNSVTLELGKQKIVELRERLSQQAFDVSMGPIDEDAEQSLSFW
jgi:hypothetical protein